MPDIYDKVLTKSSRSSWLPYLTIIKAIVIVIIGIITTAKIIIVIKNHNQVLFVSLPASLPRPRSRCTPYPPILWGRWQHICHHVSLYTIIYICHHISLYAIIYHNMSTNVIKCHRMSSHNILWLRWWLIEQSLCPAIEQLLSSGLTLKVSFPWLWAWSWSLILYQDDHGGSQMRLLLENSQLMKRFSHNMSEQWFS